MVVPTVTSLVLVRRVFFDAELLLDDDFDFVVLTAAVAGLLLLVRAMMLMI